MTRACRFLIALACSCAFGGAPDFLLPDGVAPIKETVEMTIDPARDNFDGRVAIDVELSSAVTEIWLNGKDLVVSGGSVEFLGKTHVARTAVAGGEFIGLRLDQPAGPGRARIAIRYRAPLSDKAVAGPFRRNVEGQWYAFTVFTPIDARRAFPCFDEPRFKTPWEISIRVKSSDKAFANAPQISEADEPGGIKMVRFAATQPLAAEVVAFAVGPFDVWNGHEAGAKRTPVRVITPKGHAADGEQAARVTEEILPRLEAYTGQPYPWEKLDHIALPAGAFGATENPGLITYRSRGLLVAPGGENPAKLQPLRAVQAHEIGHQWFGNLVTQAGWEDVWLSEGFATWLAAKIMDQYQPETRIHLASVAARERIMAVDSGPKTRPVRLAMTSRDDTKSVYSQIVYQKGAAVLLMLENWLGEDRFQKGLQAYLKAHAMANATTSGLAAALADNTSFDPAPVFRSFLDQTGIPNVSASVECKAGQAPGVVFEQTGSTAARSIPVCWRTGELKTTCFVLDTTRQTIALPAGSSCPAWVLANAEGAGYYRTAWTGAQINAITNVLERLTAAERLTLVYDLAALQKTGNVKAGTVEPVFRQLTQDSEPEIVHAAKVALGLEAEPERSRPR
jgi:alanyl aminopeptidase